MAQTPSSGDRNYRRFMLRGLAVLLPPVLTIVIFIWIWSTIDVYLVEPINAGVSKLAARVLIDTKEKSELSDAIERDGKTVPLPTLEAIGSRPYLVDPESELAGQLPAAPDGEKGAEWVEAYRGAYVQVTPGNNGPYIPLHVYRSALAHTASTDMPKTALGFYELYVRHEVMSASLVTGAVLMLLIVGVYFLGRLLALGLGRALWQVFEGMVFRLPLVRNVYSSVKQVTDFLLSERDDIEYRRVVAIEYPRRGIWSLGLVTGESLQQIHETAGEEVITVLIPSSPMPVTGYTVNLRKSEVIDLDMSVEQAFQFCISCGVVVPAQQLPRLVQSPSSGKTLEAAGMATAPAETSEVTRTRS